VLPVVETSTTGPDVGNSSSSVTPFASLSEHDLSRARDLLVQAKRPVIVTGLGLEPERPYQALQALVEAANAPLITAPKAKGCLAADHPLFAGTIGLTMTDSAYEILDEADCIVAVGFDVVELVKPWQMTTPLIWVAPWTNEDPEIAAEIAFVGPMTPVLNHLSDGVFTPDERWGTARVSAFRHQLSEETLPAPTSGRMRPQSVLDAVRSVISRDTVVTTDVGSHKILSALSWPAYTPNSYHVSNGLSAMGFGLLTAISASLTLEQPTVCITGDAGLSMVMGELALLKEHDLPVIVIVMNDAALDLIRAKQLRTAKPVFGTEFLNPDFSHIAAAFSIDHYQVANEAECAKAAQAALDAGRPTIIEALIDPVSYPTTPK
ncbi:MAG: thiamine pyrophosphate-dependent enzyme, partial [Chloroflexota bacterium]